MVKFSSRKQRFRSRPAHSCTPMMPKMKKTKKQSRSTFPSMGSVSSSRFTRIRMPGRGMAEEEASEKPKEQVERLRGGWRRDGVSCSCWDHSPISAPALTKSWKWLWALTHFHEILGETADIYGALFQTTSALVGMCTRAQFSTFRTQREPV